MSLYLQTLTFVPTSAWPPIGEEFPCPFDGNEVEPAWLQQCETSETIQISVVGWTTLSRFILERISKDHVVKCADHLWLFNANNAENIANKMSPLPTRIYREIEKLCRDQKIEQAPVIEVTVALRDQLQTWLRSLPVGTWGVLRLYDWGKY
jgi:hypothetical protein